MILCLILTIPVKAQPAPQSKEKDEQMINAQLRFIMESAGLTKKEYQKFAGLYIEYNSGRCRQLCIRRYCCVKCNSCGR